MRRRKKKTLEIPAEPKPDDGPVFFFEGGGDDGRDVSKPIAYDENGKPLYAPRGRVVRLPWP
jgi:hypothetical protein